MPNLYEQSFWDAEESALWEDLAEIVIGALLAGVEGGASLLPANARVLVDFDMVNSSVINYARTYRYELIKGITDTTRKQVQTLVSDWAGSGAPLGVLETQLGPLFGDVRASMIAASEVTRITMAGNAEAWESTGIVNTWTWHTVNDSAVCGICDPLEGEVFDIADQDAYMPAHINCRCFATPNLDEKAFEDALDEVFS